jgi:ABC-type nitrate/sulfonate/bicarbonate transport system substrate-binding protein
MMFIATGAINVVGMVTGAVALIFLGEGVDPATVVELTQKGFKQ